MTDPRRPACETHHQRLALVERLVQKTAQEVVVQRADLDRIADKLTGLAAAHEATLLTVQANTDALRNLGTTFERFAGRLDELITSYSAHKDADVKDKQSLTRTAIWLYGATLAAVWFFVLWAVTNWERNIAWLANHNLLPRP